MSNLERKIKQGFPGRNVHNFNVLLGGGSSVFNDIDYYIEQFAYLVRDNVRGDKIDIIGHSLGAHVARTYTQIYAGTNGYPSVRNLISVAGVNSGFYCTRWCYALPPGILTQRVLGNGFIKHNIIPANLYVNPNTQNPVGELAAMRYKKILNINRYICFYSEKDGILKPPVTAGYEFYDESLTLRPFHTSPDYVNNHFGIKDLYDSGKMEIIKLNQFTHSGFIKSQADVFYPFLEPYLK